MKKKEICWNNTCCRVLLINNWCAKYDIKIIVLTNLTPFYIVFIVDFEQVDVC